ARYTGRNNVVLVEQPQDLSAPRIESLADAAKRATPSVVSIVTSKEVVRRSPLANDPTVRRFFPGLSDSERRHVNGLGSGVIVSSDGYVLTNNHVIEDADDIQIVLLDGRQMHASVRGSDPESDLAVLKADGKDLPVITLGRLDNVQVGDPVLAIGNPYGLGNTVTHGIVSALGRNQLGANTFEDFIQTDAAINLGNSGGALVDYGGNLIGINSLIFSPSGGSQGLGFAIPVSIAKNVLEQIIRDGEVTRGWLGIEPQEITPELATALALPSPDGVLIRMVLKSSPADRAGMLARDVVLEIDGRPTRDVPGLLAQIAAMTPGTQAKLKVLRENKAVEFDVTVGKRPKARAS
ncbi:MAG TPA: trypsin-like peptidase domain-containing protein, partial [Casimicrobiaceae bacterium]|nr:trypsin-like peptidase domain-containing protein [Casimicrobiaceae bacterium]